MKNNSIHAVSYMKGQLSGRKSEKKRILDLVKKILVDEINTAHKTVSGKTSRLTSAYMRIIKLK